MYQESGSNNQYPISCYFILGHTFTCYTSYKKQDQDYSPKEIGVIGSDLGSPLLGVSVSINLPSKKSLVSRGPRWILGRRGLEAGGGIMVKHRKWDQNYSPKEIGLNYSNKSANSVIYLQIYLSRPPAYSRGLPFLKSFSVGYPLTKFKILRELEINFSYISAGLIFFHFRIKIQSICTILCMILVFMVSELLKLKQAQALVSKR